MVRRWLGRLVIPVTKWVLEKLTTEHTVRGFRVRVLNSEPDVETGQVLARLGEAIDLIATYQPGRLAHLRRDISHFIIRRYASRGAYLARERAVLTELTFLARRDIGPAVVASSVLHEGVHARIHRMARGRAVAEPAREERICRRAELAFGHALPAELGAPVIARAEQALALRDDEIAPRFSEAEGWAAIRRADQAKRRARAV